MRDQIKINFYKCRPCEGTGKYNDWWSGKEKQCPVCKGKGEVADVKRRS